MVTARLEQEPKEPYGIGSPDSLPPVLPPAESVDARADAGIVQLGGQHSPAAFGTTETHFVTIHAS